MTYEQEIRTIITSNTTIPATKVYALVAPEDATTPFVTFTQLSKKREYTHEGYTGGSDRLVQVSFFGSTYQEAKSQAKAFNSADLYTSTNVAWVKISNETDEQDSDTGRYFTVVDIIVKTNKEE